MAVVRVTLFIFVMFGLLGVPLLLAISIISPRAGLFWSKDKSKKKAYIVYLSAFVLSLFAAIALPALIGAPTADGRSLPHTAFDPWPYSVTGDVLCINQDAQMQHVVLRSSDGQVYAINGTAQSSGKYLDPHHLWMDNPAIPGTKISVRNVISRGLELCR